MPNDEVGNMAVTRLRGYMAGCLALSGRLDFFNLPPTLVTPYMSTKGSSLLRELTGEISGSVSFLDQFKL